MAHRQQSQNSQQACQDLLKGVLWSQGFSGRPQGRQHGKGGCSLDPNETSILARNHQLYPGLGQAAGSVLWKERLRPRGRPRPAPTLEALQSRESPVSRESLAWPQPVSSPTIAPSCPQAGQPLALFMWLLKVQTLLCYVTILSSFREKLSNAVLFLFFFFHF